MLPADIHRQLRRLRIRARRTVEGIVGGEYQSCFKGAGMVFEEVREYQPGDDIRAIDWNVTARMGHPFVKRYVEERDLTVMLAVDESQSLAFGTGVASKRTIAAELAAVLAFSAVSRHDKVGLVGFTDRIERFVPPAHGARHALRLVRDVLYETPRRRETSITAALAFLHRVLRRRAVVVVLSDFLDSGFESALRRLGHRHDVILIRLTDIREEELANVGLIELEDAETGQTRMLDTTRAAVRQAFAEAAIARRLDFQRFARAARVEWMEAATNGSHLDALSQFLRRLESKRNK
jgi:uncharacterized protein (DUF58 family)